MKLLYDPAFSPWLRPWLSLAILALGCEPFSWDSDVPTKVKTCVDDLQAAEKASFPINEETMTALRASLVSTIHLKQATEKIDTEVSIICQNLARELGKRDASVDENVPAGEKATAICKTASDGIRKAREDSGTVLVVELMDPICDARASDFESCVKSCDSNLPPDLKITCSEDSASGRCESRCTGRCLEIQSAECAGSCRGTCEGRCMDKFYGTCEGRCIGDCDGVTSSGKCAGTCDGKCTSGSSGYCGEKCEGQCRGSCVEEMRKGDCDGTCSGECRDGFQDLHCTEMLPPAEMIPACHARCGMELATRQRCNAGHAELVVFSTADKEKAKRLKSALGRPLTMVHTAKAGSARALEDAAKRLEQSFESIQESVDPKTTGKGGAAKCLATARKEKEKAMATIESLSIVHEGMEAAIRR